MTVTIAFPETLFRDFQEISRKIKNLIEAPREKMEGHEAKSKVLDIETESEAESSTEDEVESGIEDEAEF